MTKPQPYTPAEVDKLGNTLIYLAQRLGPISKTKVLKLLYLIQEQSVKQYGLPFFNLRFLVWRLGPVAEDVFVGLSSEETTLLDAYIQRSQQDGKTYISSDKPFQDDEFSDNEIGILERVADTYGQLNANDLVALTHRPHSLWYQTASQYGVLEYLEAGTMPTTDYEIDFGQLLDDAPDQKRLYEGQLAFWEVSKALKV